MPDVKLNHRLFPSSVQNGVIKYFQDLSWNLESDVPTGNEIRDIGLHFFPDMERGESSVNFLHLLMIEYWESAPSAWHEIALSNLQQAMEEHWMQADAEQLKKKRLSESKEAVRREANAARLAAERAAKVERERQAQENKRIAKDFNISVRHARTLRNEGTPDRKRAARLAELIGGDPGDYIRKGRRKRETDLVDMFMNVEHNEVSFTRFICDPDDQIANGSLRSLFKKNIRKFRWGEDVKSLEALLDQFRDLCLESPSLEAAQDLWTTYKLWRIRTISSIANFDVVDGR